MSLITKYQLFLEFYADRSRVQKTRTDEITLEDAVRIYKEHCNNWNLNREQIYRGTSPGYESRDNMGHDYFFIDPKGKYRESAYAEGNTYNSFFDVIPSWEGVPKRSESIIMTNDQSLSENFGSKAYVMIPYNNTSIVMCPDSDIWISMNIMHKIIKDTYPKEDYINLESFDNQISDFFKSNIDWKNIKDLHMVSKMGNKFIRINRDTIVKLSEEIDKIPKENLNLNYSYTTGMGGEPIPYKLINIWVKKYPNMKLLDFVDMIFDFNKNGFKMVDSQFEMSVHSDKVHGTEMWSDGKFIGIDIDKFEEFVKMVKEN